MMAAAAIVPLLGYGAWSIVSSRRSNEQAVIDGNRSTATVAAARIREYVSSSAKQLKSTAAVVHQSQLKKWQQDRMLKDLGQQFREFAEIVLLDQNSRPIASSRLQPTVTIPSGPTREFEGVVMSPFMVDDAFLPSAIL